MATKHAEDYFDHVAALKRQGLKQDGSPMRVQIPAYTDRWMMGDRYGIVVKVTRTRKNARRDGGDGQPEAEIAHVLLDKSNKLVRVILADCTEV